MDGCSFFGVFFEWRRVRRGGGGGGGGSKKSGIIDCTIALHLFLKEKKNRERPSRR